MLLEDLSNCIDAKSNCHAYTLNILDKLKQVCISNPQHSHDEASKLAPRATCSTSIGRSLSNTAQSLGSA